MGVLGPGETALRRSDILTARVWKFGDNINTDLMVASRRRFVVVA
jgi:hypothetical protein